MDGEEQIIEESEGLAGYVNSDWDCLEEDYSTKRAGIEVAQLQEELDGKKQDRVQRKEYANKTYWMLCVYLGLVFVLLGLAGTSVFELDDTVLIALITTTTVNVIGIFIFVTKYLFHTKE